MEQEERTFMPLRVHPSQLEEGVNALWLRAFTCREELQLFLLTRYLYLCIIVAKIIPTRPLVRRKKKVSFKKIKKCPISLD